MSELEELLLVDDEDFFRERLARAIAKRGFAVHQAANYDEAMTIIREQHPSMAVVDLKMPGKSGLEVVRDGLLLHDKMRIVVLTGYGSIATATDAIRLGAYGYLPKPADVGDILNAFSAVPDLEVTLSSEDIMPPSLARTEWEHINRVLGDCDGNISETAKRLGIHRRTLQRKLYKFAPRS